MEGLVKGHQVTSDHSDCGFYADTRTLAPLRMTVEILSCWYWCIFVICVMVESLPPWLLSVLTQWGHEPSSPSGCSCLLFFYLFNFFSPQQRNYPRTSLRRPEPTAGGTGEWTWQRRLSRPAAPAAITDPASAPRPPPPTHAPPPFFFCLLLSWTTSRHRACWLPNVRTSCQPHSPGIG